MDSHKNPAENTSTPKRRRLGTSRLLCSKDMAKHSPIHRQISSTVISSSTRCESPPLPCNQVEYLTESGNHSCSSIPCSPGILESSIMNDVENWESLALSSFRKKNNEFNDIIIEEDLSNDIFLETSCPDQDTSATKCEKHLKEIEESFDLVNKSICDIDNMVDRSCMFETKDSFLLDIKESGIVAEDKSKPSVINKAKTNQRLCDGSMFYGLPLVTKSLFKSCRNIEKFYDWQEECLNLDAIRERHNLIYALPTSGGKTLVAEVLMLNEVLNRKQNALFILPFVAIVQEKIWALSPFAVKLDFLVEEYAGGKGHIPPKKRRKKNSIYIATIEKGLALVRSLIEMGRLHEIGLIVVDELHLIGEPGRGGTLETLLTTVIFANRKMPWDLMQTSEFLTEGIQIVGMSATIGNLPDVARFLQAEVFQRQFRPVELTEYVKLGDMLYRMVTGDGLELVPERQLVYDHLNTYSYIEADFRKPDTKKFTQQEEKLLIADTIKILPTETIQYKEKLSEDELPIPNRY